MKMGAVSTVVYKTYEISLVRPGTYIFQTLFALRKGLGHQMDIEKLDKNGHI